MRLFRRKEIPFLYDSEAWKKRWQSLVPAECRDVPVTVDGRTELAYVQMNQFVMMLQDGLLMEASFFDVCALFQKAGYHVIWLMRCTQDEANNYLKRHREKDGRCWWTWRSPTTNFGRWTSDNLQATILLQVDRLPMEGDLRTCQKSVLRRVTWAQSDDAAEMIPSKTRFSTVDTPSTPQQLLRWLEGTPLSKVK